MKCFRLLLLVNFLFFSHSCLSQSNNILIFSYFKGNGEDGLHLAFSDDGMNWKALNKDSSLLKPMVGKEKLMRDPCIISGKDGLFHMVWTASWKDKGIGYASSKDLVHWSAQQFIPVMQQETGALNCWAPEITYDPNNDQYMIYWATTIPGRFPETDTSGDDKYNHRIYFVTTKNFKTFSDTKILYNRGFNVIDASIVKAGSEYIMFLKDETRNPSQKNIRIAKAVRATGPYSVPSRPITGPYWAEGPTATRLNGKWIVYFDKYEVHSMGAVTSPDGKEWTDISDKVNFPSGTRHGTVLSITASEWNKLSTAINAR